MNGIMKSLTKTSLRLASLPVLVLVFAVSSASAQNARIQTSQLDVLATKASQTVDVNIDEKLIQLAVKFLAGKGEEAKVKDLVNGLKGIYVKSFQFETEGQFSAADLEGIRTQLRSPGWSKILNVFSRKEGTVEVYLMQTGTSIGGLALLATDEKEITVVNIVGPVDLEKLTQLEGQFGIPELELEKSKPRKN
jgi:hypothetical protein